MSSVQIACAADGNYAPHSAAMLQSALVHNRRLVAHYLHGPAFPPDDAERLAGMFDRSEQRLMFHQIADQRIAGLPVQDLFGPAMWYRIFLPELLPEVERLLYLDVDALILDRLDPLWDLELEGHLLGAVQNVFMPYHAHHAPELGIDPATYFNSGVLLLNLEQMRRDGFTEAALELARSRGSALIWPDQDTLNLVVDRRWLPLHPRWNVMNSMVYEPRLARDALGEAEVTHALGNPAIRHFEGEGYNKPWHAHHQRAGQRLYRNYRRATPWPRYPLTGGTRWERIKARGALVR